MDLYLKLTDDQLNIKTTLNKGDIIMKYTVNFLFTPDGKEVLLVKKNKTSYIGKLNGVGGKCESEETFEQCAIREIREETGAIIPNRSLHYLGTLNLPYDCVSGPNNNAEIAFYSAIVNKYEVSQQEDEELVWMDTSILLDTKINNPNLAGDGDILYMINNATKYYKWNEKTS